MIFKLKNIASFFALAGLTLVSSCDETDPLSPLEVNFTNTDLGISESTSSVDVGITFSRSAESAGALVLTVSGDLIYGNDYTTDPAAANNTIVLAYSVGDESVSFSVAAGESLNIDEDKTLTFTLSDPDDVLNLGTNNTIDIVFSENFVVPSALVTSDVGGNERTHQFYIDLSTGTTKKVDRNNYDLALESAGNGYNILLNATTIMLAHKTEETEFASVTEADAENLTLQADQNADLADQGVMFSGNFSETTFYNWDENGDVSNVFIIDRGISSNSGGERGMKKVQVTKSGNDYTIKSADLDGTNETEFTIGKSADHSFKYVHFENGEADIAPVDASWDMVLTATTQVAYYQGAYYSVYNSQAAFHNYFGGTLIAVIDIDGTETTFDDIALSEAQNALSASDNDLNMLGINWRGLDASFQYSTFSNLIYILEDLEGNVFKLQFTEYYDNEQQIAPLFQYEHLR